VVEATDAANSPIRLTLPLDGFAEAYADPPQQLRVIEEVTEAQTRARLEREKRAEEERKLRCGSPQ
jgi:hypothetical protein